MRVMAQMAMVMNLDKCIGCHTCSVTCKQAWTNRAGTEYVWFNNVETRPGLGYPRGYEDQDEWQGGWVVKNGRLSLRAGGRLKKLLTIFSNPKMPSIQDYYEPWTYDYETLLNAPAQKNFPVARPHSLISGKPINVSWSANWDDDLGGSREHAAKDVMLRGIEDKVTFEFEQTFMFYLPRICEHCLNPSCAASCPSGAIYKREEDGIVLVDQDRCRGWRMCITGCPYKKIYFNHKTGKAEKCTFCYPRIEVGIPTVCSETCVGRLRYIGLVLYDADKVLEAASAPDDIDLYESQLGVFLDPEDPEVRRAAEAAGIPGDWVEAARRSPVKKLIMDYKVALPLHPEYRTMPMVWYIPPLSPVVDVIKDTGYDAEDVDNLFGAIDTLRIPVEYLANLFTAGDVAPVNRVLKKLAAMRSYMRDINLGRDPRDEIPAAVGMEGEAMYDMFRLLALAKYDERYVIPTAHAEQAHALEELATDCAVSEYGGGQEIFGEGSGAAPTPVAVENFRVLQQTQSADTMQALPSDNPMRGRVNLLNWDGRGMPDGMFPHGRRRLRAGGREVKWRRHRDAQPRHQRARAGRHLAARVTAARLPGCRAGAAGADAARRSSPTLPDAQCAPLDRGARHPRARVTSDRAAGRLRRHVRRHPQVLAAPHVLRPGRHPAARRGPGGVQAGLPQGRCRVRHRRRAARSPLRRAGVRGGAGLGHHVAPAAPATGSASRCSGPVSHSAAHRGCPPCRRCGRPCPSSTVTTRRH